MNTKRALKYAGMVVVAMAIASTFTVATVTKLRNVWVELGTATNYLTGQQGNSGIVQQSGTIAGTGDNLLCTDANLNDTTTGCSPIQLFTNKNLGAPVSVSGSTVTAIDSIAVTLPSVGGPWRIFVHYDYIYNTGGNGEFYLSDGTTQSCETVHPPPSATWGAAQCSQLSSSTYANSTSVTFTVYDYDQGGTTVVTSGGFSGSRPSHMQVGIIGSN
jgi:hypothetical protein